MKRVSLAITSFVLYLLFFILYGIAAIREFFAGLNARIATIYENLYAFFNFTWDKSIGHLIVYDASGLHHPIVYGVIQVFIWLLVLVLIIELIATISLNHARNSSIKYRKIIDDEKNKLRKIDDKPIVLKRNENQGKFANNVAPYVSLDEELAESGEKVVVDPRIKKPRPAIRIIITIILFILTAAFIYLRMLWSFNYPGQYDLFYGLFHMENVIHMNEELTAFFGALFQRAYSVPMAVIAGMQWSWGNLFELLAIFLMVALIWLLILLITHLLLRHIRQIKSQKKLIDIDDDENNFSSQALSIMGNADLKTVGADISVIANITPSKIASERNKQLHNQAMYIYDISENVKPVGSTSTSHNYIPPSQVRQPLVDEELDEDLSGNVNVGIEDISSIEDNEVEEVVNYNGYNGEQEELPQVNLGTIDISTIATLQKKLKSEVSDNKEDDISFDEDGYAYLLKKGKPFIDEENDISDVIDATDLEKSVIVARYGIENYATLNSLEPFELKKMDYDEEVNNIRMRKRELDVISADKLLKESLSRKPFSETNVEGIQDIRKNILPPDNRESSNSYTKYSNGDMNFTTDQDNSTTETMTSVKDEKITEKVEMTNVEEKKTSPSEQDADKNKSTDSFSEIKRKDKPSKSVISQNNITTYNVPKIKIDSVIKKDKIESDKKVIDLKKNQDVEEKIDYEKSEIAKPRLKPIRPIKLMDNSLNVQRKVVKPRNITASEFNLNEKKQNDGVKKDESIVDDDIKKQNLKSIASIERIEGQEKSRKPVKPVDARKVEYDIFIGKKK
ncbi:MAG: hypothetical protein PHW22_04535 [Bacilli bacterium]|nr:hypothetical protein [Bacilli bacterium]